MIDKIRREPALVIDGIRAVIALAAAFGLAVNDQQTAAIIAAAAAVLALVGAPIVRSKVTPASEVAAKRDPKTGKFVSAKADPAAPDGAKVTLRPYEASN